jgi:hypothetical protein
LRRIEWFFVLLFITGGLYCLAIVAGLISPFPIPLPGVILEIQPYLRRFEWVMIVVGLLISAWLIWCGRKYKK